VSDITDVCFVGIYGHNQDEALKCGLERRDIDVAEVNVENRTLSEACEQLRPPILPMRGTMNWMSDVPSPVFPVLVLGVLAIHTLAVWYAVLRKTEVIRSADVLVVPHIGDTSVIVVKPVAVLINTPIVYLSHNGIYYTIIQARGLYSEHSVAGRFLFWLERIVHRLSDSIVVFSERSAEVFSERFQVPRERYDVVYIAALEWNFDRDPFASDSRESGGTKEELSSDVLYWGNFHPHHGLSTMVKTAAELPSVDFSFVGMSHNRERVIDLADKMGTENIEFPGRVSLPELSERIAAATLVLGPLGDNPLTEFTIGTKVAEAAYMRKAILVGRQPGVEEIFEHREDAYLVFPGDSAELVEGIEALLADAELRRRIEAGAAETYENHLSTDAAADRLLAAADRIT